jgi:hypothetical protein
MAMRVTARERDLIVAEAERTGLSVAELLRLIVLPVVDDRCAKPRAHNRVEADAAIAGR